MTRSLFPDSAGPGVTVLEYIQAHLDPSGCGLIPEAGDLPGTAREGEIRWMPGAADGVGTHHSGRGRPDAVVDEIVKLMGRVISGRSGPPAFGALYERLRAASALSYIDDLISAVARSALPRSGIHEIARRIAVTGRHPEPVKAGIALLGISGGQEDADLLLTLGRHEELTLYCAVALANSSPDPESALWSLAKSVDGWGRIQSVERLKKTERDDIQDWLVRYGFRNKIMNEYLVYTAATTGKLLDRLRRPDSDQDLLRAARDIVCALITAARPRISTTTRTPRSCSACSSPSWQPAPSPWRISTASTTSSGSSAMATTGISGTSEADSPAAAGRARGMRAHPVRTGVVRASRSGPGRGRPPCVLGGRPCGSIPRPRYL